MSKMRRNQSFKKGEKRRRMSVADGAILRAKNESISLEWGAINSVYALFSRFVTTFQIMDSNRSRRRPNREFIFYHEKPAFLKPQKHTH